VQTATALSASTAALSAPTRAIQGAIGTPLHSSKLGFQYLKRYASRKNMESAGLFNAERMKKRLTKQTAAI